MITAIIPHFWTSRDADLPRIVAALRDASVVPEAIIIWNNTERAIGVPGADVINAGRNWGIAARYAAAYLARTEYVLFQDNDVLVQPMTLEAMLRELKKWPGDVSIELQGRMLGNPPNAYATSTYLTNIDRGVDIGLSRLSLMRRATAMKLAAVIPPDVQDDDIWTSRHVSVRLIPYGAASGWINLPESEGLSLDVGAHIARRDALVRQLW